MVLDKKTERYIKRNWKKHTDKEMGQEIGVTARTVRSYRAELGLKRRQQVGDPKTRQRNTSDQVFNLIMERQARLKQSMEM